MNEGSVRAGYWSAVQWPAQRFCVLNGGQLCSFKAGGGSLSGSSSLREEVIFPEVGQPCCGRGRI